jgi:hypothetical protein
MVGRSLSKIDNDNQQSLSDSAPQIRQLCRREYQLTDVFSEDQETFKHFHKPEKFAQQKTRNFLKLIFVPLSEILAHLCETLSNSQKPFTTNSV